MKIAFILIFALLNIYASELIYVSNLSDNESLKKLQEKYKKDIIISSGNAYVVPSECLLERHFGGLSQTKVRHISEELLSGNIATNQKIFEAKDAKEIEEEIQKQKMSDQIEGRVAKAFLDNTDGHLYGGLSQGRVSLEEQKIVVKEAASLKHPTCKLLNEGLGYEIFGVSEPKIYKNGQIYPIEDTKILFK